MATIGNEFAVQLKIVKNVTGYCSLMQTTKMSGSVLYAPENLQLRRMLADFKKRSFETPLRLDEAQNAALDHGRSSDVFDAALASGIVLKFVSLTQHAIETSGFHGRPLNITTIDELEHTEPILRRWFAAIRRPHFLTTHRLMEKRPILEYAVDLPDFIALAKDVNSTFGPCSVQKKSYKGRELYVLESSSAGNQLSSLLRALTGYEANRHGPLTDENLAVTAVCEAERNKIFLEALKHGIVLRFQSLTHALASRYLPAKYRWPLTDICDASQTQSASAHNAMLWLNWLEHGELRGVPRTKNDVVQGIAANTIPVRPSGMRVQRENQPQKNVPAPGAPPKIGDLYPGLAILSKSARV